MKPTIYNPSLDADDDAMLEQIVTDIKASRRKERRADDMRFRGREIAPQVYDREDPQTTEEILWSWSEGHISGVDAQRRMDCDVHGLRAAADERGIPHPNRGTAPTGTRFKP
jgi:hypothetical protein